MTDEKLVELAKQCQEDSAKWFPDANNLVHHSLALAGEVGEFCNIIKKVDRGSLSFSEAKVRYDLAMEITDVFIYVLNIAGLMHIDLEKTYMIKRTENNHRFTPKEKS